jgi:hypothetical protein
MVELNGHVVPYRLLAAGTSAPSSLVLTVLLEDGELRLELPDGDDAAPGEVVVADATGARRLPDVYRSPARHALLRLALALTSGKPDTASLREHLSAVRSVTRARSAG